MGLVPSAVGTTSYSPVGLLVERDTDDGLHISGLLTGVEASVSAEYHVHGPNPFASNKLGYTCEEAGPRRSAESAVLPVPQLSLAWLASWGGVLLDPGCAANPGRARKSLRDPWGAAVRP